MGPPAGPSSPSDPSGGSGANPGGSGANPGTGSGSNGAGGVVANSSLTYYSDVLPILQKSCLVGCHAQGGSGQPALDSYESASASAKAILAAVQNGTMPPFPPAAGCSQYQDELRLTAAEQATLTGWAQGGAAAGDPASAPPFSPPPPATTLGTPDRELTVPSFTPTYPGSAGPNDLYWCYPLNPNVTVDTDLIAAEIVPGVKNEVHHVIISRDVGGTGTAGKPASGFECNGVPGEMLYAWVPGARPFQLPSGVGMTLAANDRLYMQVHYHRDPSITPSPDSTRTRLYYAKSTQPQHAYVVWTGTPIFSIPANTVGYQVNATCSVNGNWKVIGIAPHMHTIGVKFNLSAQAAQANQCLMTIPRWDFNWQGGYWLQQPLDLKPGDKLATSCVFNNNTNSAVSFGESTGNEMCFGFVTIVAAQKPVFNNIITQLSGLSGLCPQ